jgi:hypothetical protein
MITTTLTNNLKQRSKIDMILDTGTIVKNVKVGWRNNNMADKILETSIHIEKVFPMVTNPDYPNYKINMVLESPPIKNGNRS